MRTPESYEVNQLLKSDRNQTEIEPGNWVEARPHDPSTRYGFTQRFKAAFAVLTGKADALFWYKQ